MTTDFEKQLEQMIPAMHPIAVRKTATRGHSALKIALGFLLGVLATYYFTQPDTARQTQPLETFTLVFDDSKIEHFRRPADVFQSVVRVPVPKLAIEIDQTQWQYGTMRNSLRRM